MNKIWPMLLILMLIGISAYGETSPIVNWKYEAGGILSGNAAADESTVYFGGTKGQIYALNRSDGSLKWMIQLSNDGEIRATPLISEGKLYTAGYKSKKIACFQLDTQTQLWEFETGGGIESSPRIEGKLLIFGSMDQKVYALNSTDGTKVWEFETSGAVRSSALITNGKVYIGSSDQNFYCLELKSGQKLWSFQSDGEIISTAAYADGKVYFGSKDKKVYCLNAENGEKAWDFSAERMFLSSPIVKENRVYIGSYDRNLYCLDSLSGQKIWNFTAADSISASPTWSGNQIFFTSFDKNLYSISADKGELLWTLSLSNTVKASPLVREGSIYIASGDGFFYSVQADTRDLGLNSLVGPLFYSVSTKANTNTLQSNVIAAPEATPSPSTADLGKGDVVVQPLEETNILEPLPTTQPLSSSEVVLTNYVFETNQVILTNWIDATQTGIAASEPDAGSGQNEMYAVQVGAFTRSVLAQKMYDDLKAFGLPVYRNETTVHGQGYIRVRVGKFSSLAEAIRVKSQLDQMGYKGMYILRIITE